MANQTSETIELRNLSIGYYVKGEQRCVADNISATIESSRLTCLIGANGVGKSTLLRTLSAFQPKLGGHIYIKGKEIEDFDNVQLSRHIGVVLTGKPDVTNLTVEELVGLGRTPYTGFFGTLRPEDKEVVDESMRMTGISHLRERMIGTLSDGERQKMMIAKALAQETPVIFLDEPTAFLDYPSKVEMMQLLHRLSRKMSKTIFLSTHDIELTLQIADTIWLMNAGGTLSVGTPEELASGGDMALFLNGPGISFDPKTMTVRVKRSDTM